MEIINMLDADKSINRVKISIISEKPELIKRYETFPYIMSNLDPTFKKSYIDDFIYFRNYRDKLYVNNLD